MRAATQPVVTPVDAPYTRAKEEKAKGRKVVGITPMHFPEELVHASGALPVTLQESTEPVTLGAQYIWPNFCGFTRSNVDWGLKGDLDFFDAIVVSDVCLETRMCFDLMRQKMKVPFIYIGWPQDYDMARWRGVAVSRLQRVKRSLEEVVGRPIADRDIRQSIELYNRNRQLLRAIYQVRQEKPGVLRARELQDLVVSSMVTPKEEHNQLLEGVLARLQAAPSPASQRVKVFLSGHMCYIVKPDILDLVEELGAVVVGDDLYAGYRYYAAQVPTDIDPLDALAHRYFNAGVPCPSKCGAQGDWADHILSAVQETGAHGVISLMPKYCEPQMFYHPYIRNRMTTANVPYIFVETEHEIVSLEGIKTRIEAFVESLSGRTY